MTLEYQDYIEEQAEIERRRERQEAIERFVPPTNQESKPMTKTELLDWIKDRATEYRAGAAASLGRNMHMFAPFALGEDCSLQQDDIDAVLTDFINFCGTHQGIDFNLRASDLVVLPDGSLSVFVRT